MDLGLRGKVAVVTGASRGIGKAIASALLHEGCAVAICGRNAERLNATVEDLSKNGARVIGVPTDVTDEAAVGKFVGTATEAFGRIDILINNAGVRARQKFEEFSRDAFNHALAVNVTAPFFACQAVTPIMRRQGGGRIIHIASQMGTVAHERRAVYGMTKAALIYLAKAMAYELAPDGITVNAISPGPILTEYMEHEYAKNSQLANDRAAYMRINRVGRPDEIAEVALFLAGSAPDLLMGQNLIVDGGYTIH